FASLLMLRLALGFAEGPGFPAGAQTMQRVLPASERARGFGLLFTGSSIGGMLAPPVATLLFRHAGWRIAFLGTPAIGRAWVPLWIALTRRADVRARLDVRGPAAPRPRAIRALLANPAMIRALIGVFAVAPVVGFGYAWAAKYLVREHGIAQGHVGAYLW